MSRRTCTHEYRGSDPACDLDEHADTVEPGIAASTQPNAKRTGARRAGWNPTSVLVSQAASSLQSDHIDACHAIAQILANHSDLLARPSRERDGAWLAARVLCQDGVADGGNATHTQRGEAEWVTDTVDALISPTLSAFDALSRVGVRPTGPSDQAIRLARRRARCHYHPDTADRAGAPPHAKLIRSEIFKAVERACDMS